MTRRFSSARTESGEMDVAMPVIRISEQTWERLKLHAKPLEHRPDDVVRMALDALEVAQRSGIQIRQTTAPAPKQFNGLRHRKRYSLKLLRVPLLKTLYAMGGRAYSREIRAKIGRLVAPMFGAAGKEIVSNGQPRWWNTICSVRNDLIAEGLFRNDSEHGVWELSKRGLEFMSAEVGPKRDARSGIQNIRRRTPAKHSSFRKPGS